MSIERLTVVSRKTDFTAANMNGLKHACTQRSQILFAADTPYSLIFNMAGTNRK